MECYKASGAVAWRLLMPYCRSEGNGAGRDVVSAGEHRPRGALRESTSIGLRDLFGEPQASRPEPEGETHVKRFRDVLISCIALGAMTLPALAEDGSVSVIGRAEPGLVVPMHRAAPDYELIQISTMHRHAVGLVMRENEVEPGLAQLQMGNQPIFVDPDRKYIRRTGGIDSGHSIMRAQRAYKALTAQDTAYMIRRGELTPDHERAMIVPRAILLRPDFLQRRELQKPMAPSPLKTKVEQGPVASAK